MSGTATDAATPGTAGLGRGLRWIVDRDLTLLPVILAFGVVGAIVSDAFLTRQNLINILQQSSELSVLVLAETIVVIAARFDLSLESIVGLSAMFGAWLVLGTDVGGSGLGLNPYLGIVVMLLVGAVVGVFNGLIIVKMQLDPFIVTLAMLILLRGTTIGLSKGQTMYDLPGPLIYIGSEKWIGVPVAVWLAAFLYIAFGLWLRYHSLGRALYAIGGNDQAARAAGIRVDRVVIIAYVLAGTLAAVAGLMLTGRLASVTSGQGQNLIFFVFAAAVIGGIRLNGGRGSVWGALTGVLLLFMIQNILTLTQWLEAFWYNAIFGGIILAALVITRLLGSKSTE